jgi:hypothetical protein
MSLPDLALQIVYGRLAWALVAAALLLAILPALLLKLSQLFNHSNLSNTSAVAHANDAAHRARRTTAIVVTASVIWMSLPGAASPAYWLTLVFQYPSGLLAGFSAVSLVARWQGRAARFAMPAAFALPLVFAGLVLYLDAFGMLALGLYAGGFGAGFAPLLACVAAGASAFAIVRGRATDAAAAVLIGVLPYSLLRLPSGNLWDALLDPLLWSWALGSVVVAAARQRAARKAGQLSPQATPAPAPAPAPDLSPLPEPVLAHAAGNEQI